MIDIYHVGAKFNSGFSWFIHAFEWVVDAWYTKCRDITWEREIVKAHEVLVLVSHWLVEIYIGVEMLCGWPSSIGFSLWVEVGLITNVFDLLWSPLVYTPQWYQAITSFTYKVEGWTLLWSFFFLNGLYEQ